MIGEGAIEATFSTMEVPWTQDIPHSSPIFQSKKPKFLLQARAQQIPKDATPSFLTPTQPSLQQQSIKLLKPFHLPISKQGFTLSLSKKPPPAPS
jgi:hypothetical protein